MKTNLYVISDLHLGGAPGSDGKPGFQICPPRNQLLLANFIDSLPAPSVNEDVRLVIAGDLVDFLAEEPFQPFSVDAVATQKLTRVFEHTARVWDALQRFVTVRKGALTILLGNHDIELSLPGTRRALFERIGEGRVEFIYDNEAFTCGPVLIEHGNRFDDWNAVPHGALRRVRSQMSRGLTQKPQFPAMPGSRLVVDVMNPLKQQYAFIDLLKPEDAGALPIAAALGAGGIREVWQFFQKYRQTWSVDFDEDREPLDEEYIAAGDSTEQRLFDLAQDIENHGDASQVSFAGNALKAIGENISDRVREARRAALFQAIRGAAAKHCNTFDVEREVGPYLTAARAASSQGFQVVVYGHTHLAKRVALGGSGAFPRYINTGTWADLMRVPDAVWGADTEHSRQVLAEFVADLESNALEKWRRAVPTYAKIQIDGGSLQDADVYFADGDCSERVTTAALMKRLVGGAID